MSDIEDNIPLKSFTAKDGESTYFRYKDFYILWSIRRISDAKEVLKYVKQYKLDKPASKHSIKSLGFKIVVTDEKSEIFLYSKHPITVGDARWIYNVKRSSVDRNSIFTVSLQVCYADKPAKVDFLTKNKIEAALDAYRYGISQCEMQLRQELMRIYSDSSHALKDELKTEKTVNEREISEKTQPKKRLVRFKSRT